MGNDKLEKLTTEQLKKKESGNKTLAVIFIPVILGLFFFVLRDYFNGDEIDMPTLIIAICSIGGLVSVWQSLRVIQKILKERER